MCSGESDWTCLQPGFPIRKSSDHSLVIDSPRLIADSYVLHRFLVPRHPPCALKNLSHKDARVHCAVLNIRAAPHPTGRLPHAISAERFDQGEGPTSPHQRGGPAQKATSSCNARDPQDPTTCQAPPPPAAAFHRPVRGPGLYLRHETVPAPTNRCSTLEHLLPHTRGQTRPWTTCVASAP